MLPWHTKSIFIIRSGSFLSILSHYTITSSFFLPSLKGVLSFRVMMLDSVKALDDFHAPINAQSPAVQSEIIHDGIRQQVFAHLLRFGENLPGFSGAQLIFVSYHLAGRRFDFETLSGLILCCLFAAPLKSEIST